MNLGTWKRCIGRSLYLWLSKDGMSFRYEGRLVEIKAGRWLYILTTSGYLVIADRHNTVYQFELIEVQP